MNGNDPGIVDTETLTGDDGKTIYKFVFYPGSDPGRTGKKITVAVGENGTVIRHDVFDGLQITAANPEMYIPSLPDDVTGKGAFLGEVYPSVSIIDGDLDIKLKSVEFTNDSSLYYFVVHAMFIKELATPENKKILFPALSLKGDIFVDGRNPENVTSVYGKKWEGDAIGFSVKSDPVPADVKSIEIRIDSFSLKERQSSSSYEREGNWSYKVL